MLEDSLPLTLLSKVVFILQGKEGVL
ncbi:hypothetical protein CDIMF43_100023 [Carnobacterium divergens]|nr:hypothetical protein CDIMF43_100023 [Carnobacterium divergens]